MELTPVQSKFILHWGEMGTRWGVNRTVAQIHALLFISPIPVNAEEIAGTLSVSRGNVSMSIKELQSWGIIRTIHMLGDRRDHFESLKDPWEMFQIIMDERKKREIDPTLAVLRECVAELKENASGGGDSSQAYTRDRLTTLLDFIETMTDWYDQLRRLPTAGLIKFVKMGSKVRKFLGAA